MQNGTAECTPLLITMERWRRIGGSAEDLALFIEVFVGGHDIGPENAKSIPVKLVGSRFRHEADYSRAAALVGCGGILGFDARFVHAVLGNVECWNDGGYIVLGYAQRTAIYHVID